MHSKEMLWSWLDDAILVWWKESNIDDCWCDQWQQILQFNPNAWSERIEQENECGAIFRCLYHLFEKIFAIEHFLHLWKICDWFWCNDKDESETDPKENDVPERKVARKVASKNATNIASKESAIESGKMQKQKKMQDIEFIDNKIKDDGNVFMTAKEFKQQTSRFAEPTIEDFMAI